MEHKFNGAVLRELRIKEGWSMAELAKKIRVANQSSIARWESGEQEPRPRKIKALTVAFKVDRSVFFKNGDQ